MAPSHLESDGHLISALVETFTDHLCTCHCFRSLLNFYWHDSELREHGVTVTFPNRRLELLERVPTSPGNSVNQDRTSTFNWLDTAITIKVQTVSQHYEEQEMANLNHRRKLEEERESLDEQLAQQSPLFGFSRSLLKWIVESTPGTAPPSCERIRVKIHDSSPVGLTSSSPRSLPPVTLRGGLCAPARRFVAAFCEKFCARNIGAT